MSNAKDIIKDALLKEVPIDTGVIPELRVGEWADKLGLNIGVVTWTLKKLEKEGFIKVIANKGPLGRDIEVVSVSRGITKTSRLWEGERPAPPVHIITKEEHRDAAMQEAADKKAAHRKDVIANARALLYASDNFTSELMRQVMALRLSLEEVLKEFDNKK